MYVDEWLSQRGGTNSNAPGTHPYDTNQVLLTTIGLNNSHGELNKGHFQEKSRGAKYRACNSEKTTMKIKDRCCGHQI